MRPFDPVKAGKTAEVSDEDYDWLLSQDAEEIADCEALMASGYYDQCMCGRNGDHGFNDNDYFEFGDIDFDDDEFDWEDE